MRSDFELERFLIQWNPVNTDSKGTCQSVHFIRVSVLSRLSEKNVAGTCSIDTKTKADIFMTTKRCLIS